MMQIYHRLLFLCSFEGCANVQHFEWANILFEEDIAISSWSQINHNSLTHNIPTLEEIAPTMLPEFYIDNPIKLTFKGKCERS